MWANLHLLFWLSLVPVVTGWVGEQPAAPWPTALYGMVLLMAGLAWLVLEKRDHRGQRAGLGAGPGRPHGTQGEDLAGPLRVGIGLAFVRPWIADLLYAVVALLWFVPDRRIEAKVAGDS